MKRIISILLAVVIVATGFAFPVSANNPEEPFLITEDMISAEGAAIEYDSYLSAYKITPVEAGGQVKIMFTELCYGLAIWVPATAADAELDFVAENDKYFAEFSVAAGHKFSSFDAGFIGNNAVISYTPSDVYSIYIYDKMRADGYSFLLEDQANGSLAKYDEEYLDLDTYEVERYTKYYWDEDIVFNESFFVLEEKDGTLAPNAMMYEIDRVVSVKNSYLNVEYVYGEDYLVEDGKLVIPETSSIKRYTYDTVYKENNTLGTYWDTIDGRYVYAGQYDMYFVGYLNITYTVKDAWDGPVPESKAMYLDNITEKLNADGGTVKILGIGDSIAGGANVSSDIGNNGVAPYADPWCEMASKAIQEKYPDVTVDYKVIAQGGATATLAIEKMNEIVLYEPDVLMIEFGTNECMAGESDTYYINTLKQAIAAVNEKLPDCDIILVAPIISNPLIFPSDWFYAYADALYSLEREGVAVSDTVSILQYILSRKDYIDMTGDFLCHPNDFANRVFVQSILKTLEDGSEADYINGLANRITKYRYEAEFDEADWAEFCRLAKIAEADILASTTAEEAREKYMYHTDILDAVPTSLENIANSSIDVSKLIFNSMRTQDVVGETSNVDANYDIDEVALRNIITKARTPYVTLDYTKGDEIVSADGYDYAVITMRAPLTNGAKAKQSKVAYTTATGECATTTIDLILDGAYHSYIIDLSNEANWAGDIESLKLYVFSSSAVNDILYVNSIILATDSQNAADIAIERERAANKNAAEAVTYLMSDDATTAILTTAKGEDYFAGDINGDGDVTAKDSLLMKRVLAGVTTTVQNPAAMDMNRDGDINSKDSALIRATLAGIMAPVLVSGSDADISYCTDAKAAKIVLGKDDAVISADLSDKGLSADMFKYVTVCAKNANGEAVSVSVTLTYEDGESTKTVTIPSDDLFGASVVKYTEAGGNILSIAFVFDAEAGETVYLDSFVFTPTVSAAENAIAVRVGAANLS